MLKFLTLFALFYLEVAWGRLYSAQYGIDAFKELLSISKTDPVRYADAVLAEHYQKMGAADFNETMLFILDYYYHNPDSRQLIYEFVTGSLKAHLGPVMTEQKHDHWHWESVHGAVNGVFLLTLARMGVRLSGRGIFKDALKKIPRIVLGKRGGGVNQLALQGSAARLRVFLHNLAGDWRKQYLLASLGGGALGMGAYFWRHLHRKINPAEALYAINQGLLAEAALVSCYAHHHPFEIDLELVGHYLSELKSLMEVDPRLSSGISADQVRISLAAATEIFPLREFDWKKACTLETLLADGDRVHPEGVLAQLENYLDE